MGECLRILCQNNHASWVTCLGRIEQFINLNFNETTEALPIEVHDDRPCVLEIERYLKFPQIRRGIAGENMKNKVKEKIRDKAEKRKRYQRVRMIEFQEGQQVIVIQ